MSRPAGEAQQLYLEVRSMGRRKNQENNFNWLLCGDVRDALSCQPKGDQGLLKSINSDMREGYALVEKSRALFLSFDDISIQPFQVLDTVVLAAGCSQCSKDCFLLDRDVPDDDPSGC